MNGLVVRGTIPDVHDARQSGFHLAAALTKVLIPSRKGFTQARHPKACVIARRGEVAPEAEVELGDDSAMTGSHFIGASGPPKSSGDVLSATLIQRGRVQPTVKATIACPYAQTLIKCVADNYFHHCRQVHDRSRSGKVPLVEVKGPAEIRIACRKVGAQSFPREQTLQDVKAPCPTSCDLIA